MKIVSLDLICYFLADTKNIPESIGERYMNE